MFLFNRSVCPHPLDVSEYVAPEKIENILIQSPLVGQCFVYGDSFQNYVVAIVVPDEEPVRMWAQKAGLEKLSFAELCRSPQLKEAVMDDIRKLSKASGLHGFETVRAAFLEHELFSAENDLATPTFKLKRQKLRDHYEKEIAELYASLPPPKSRL